MLIMLQTLLVLVIVTISTEGHLVVKFNYYYMQRLMATDIEKRNAMVIQK